MFLFNFTFSFWQTQILVLHCRGVCAEQCSESPDGPVVNRPSLVCPVIYMKTIYYSAARFLYICGLIWSGFCSRQDRRMHRRQNSWVNLSFSNCYCYRSRDNSDQRPCHELDNRGIGFRFQSGKTDLSFLYSVQAGSSPSAKDIVQWKTDKATDSSLRIEMLEHEATHSPPYTMSIKNTCIRSVCLRRWYLSIRVTITIPDNIHVLSFI